MTVLAPRDTATESDRDLQGADGWRPRSDVDLLVAQLRALDAWHRLVTHAPVGVPGQSREARLDEVRRKDIADRERDALYAWAERALVDDPFDKGAFPRAVVAHRNDWLRDKVCSLLHEKGVAVIASTGDGAEASAAVVMEQPDLVFVEDLLPCISGVELARRVTVLAPDAVVAGHAQSSAVMPPLLDAGARTVFSRRIPPAELAAGLFDLLHGADVPRTVV